jgi:hypothetical protein
MADMAWAHVLRPQEMATYRRCRRAWDFGARTRQNLIPAVPPSVFDFDRAIHNALAVYYFPAMDDWDRAIVRPLALKGFARSMEEDRARYEAGAALTPEQEEEWERAMARGEAMLNGYFAWAAPLDTFASIFADQEYWAPIPDPANPGSDLVNAAGREIRYLGRIDQLFSDRNDEYWIVDHRLVGEDWEDDDQLLLDTEGLAALWAVELTYPQLRIAGTVYNELRVPAEPDAAPGWESTDVPFDERTMRRARHVNTRRSPLTPEESVWPDADYEVLASGAPPLSVEGRVVPPDLRAAGADDGAQHRPDDGGAGGGGDGSRPGRLPEPRAGALQHLRLPGAVHRDERGGRPRADPGGVLPAPHRTGGRGGAAALVDQPGPDAGLDERQEPAPEHGQLPLGVGGGLPRGTAGPTSTSAR